VSSFFDPTLFGAVFVTLFVIMDPLGSIPLFLGLTGGRSNRTRARLAGQAVLVSLLVITLFAVVGQQILEFLGIGIPALQGAGGLLLLIVALELLTDRSDAPSEVRDVNVGPGAARHAPARRPGRHRGHHRVRTAVRRRRGHDGDRGRHPGDPPGRLPVAALQRRHHPDHPGERHRAADPHRGPAAVAIAVQLVADSVRGFVGEG
jgi:hypothetical protein